MGGGVNATPQVYGRTKRRLVEVRPRRADVARVDALVVSLANGHRIGTDTVIETMSTRGDWLRGLVTMNPS